MDVAYFSDRERGLALRVREEIDSAAWGGIASIIQSRISDGALGRGFSESCPDGRGTTGTNCQTFTLSLKAEIPGISWPFDTQQTPPTLGILDLMLTPKGRLSSARTSTEFSRVTVLPMSSRSTDR